MALIPFFARFRHLLTQLDGKLLFLLIFVLNVKLAVKIPALAIVCLLQPGFLASIRLREKRVPPFYLVIMGIGLVNWMILAPSAPRNYTWVALSGLAFWGACLLLTLLLRQMADTCESTVMRNTLTLFFMLNALLSAGQLLSIMLEIGQLNPYTYQGQFQKYFIGTGDYIKGITLDTSTTNAAISAAGVLYFLCAEKPLLTAICFVTLLLTGSNYVNLLVTLLLLAMFLFKSSRNQKSIVLACLAIGCCFMAKVSPQNNKYVKNTVRRLLHPEPVAAGAPVPEQPTYAATPALGTAQQQFARRYLDSVQGIFPEAIPAPSNSNAGNLIVSPTGHPELPVANIHSASYQSPESTPREQLPLKAFIQKHRALLPLSGQPGAAVTLPGKVLGGMQTATFFVHHPAKAFLGTGMGNFSSKLAFKATALGVTGRYPEQLAYIHPQFLVNHLDLYLDYFSKRAGYHSLMNSPFSVYDQVAGEYGFLGLIALALGYFGFFLRPYRPATYALPLLALLAGLFFTDYWFEQLSIVPLFELLWYVDRRLPAQLMTERP